MGQASRLVLVVSVLLVLQRDGTVEGRFDRLVCERQMPTAAPNPPPNPVVPPTFEVHVDCKIGNRNSSTEVHEYYDYQNNRGVMHQIEFSAPFYLYYDYSQNQMLTVFPNQKNCMVDRLSSDLNRFLFGYKRADGQGHVFAPSAALHFGFDSLISAYIGSDVVRGIRVHTWYSCQYVAEFDATVNVYWSFSDSSNWDTAVGYPDTPVRCRVNGMSRNQNDPNNGSHPFEHTYDFVHFKDFISIPSVFEIPEGTVCPGQTNTKPVPAIPAAFSFTVEAINPTDSQVSFMQEWYDYSLQVVKFRYVPGPFQSLLYGPRPLTEVHDFGTGVAYIMDEMLGNCTVTQIERGVFDDAMKDLTHVRLRTAVEFFYLDNTHPVYMGQKTIREVSCDTWVGQKSNFPPGSNMTAVAEWSFRTGNWTSTLEQQNSSVSGGTPVQMHLTVAGEPYDYNFFHFLKARPDVLTFDVSSCYTNRRRHRFDFAVSNQFASQIQKNLREFQLSVVDSVISVTKLSPLRIADVQVVFSDNVHIRVSLLDKAPISGDVSQVRAQPDLDASANALLQAIQSNSFIIGESGPQTQSPLGRMAVMPDSVTEYAHDSDLTTPTTAPSVSITPATRSPATSTASPGGPTFSPGRSTASPTTPVASRTTVPTSHRTQKPTSGQNIGNTGSSGGYSPGAMGGLGIGTLILGVVLGTGSAFIFVKRTSHR